MRRNKDKEIQGGKKEGKQRKNERKRKKEEKLGSAKLQFF